MKKLKSYFEGKLFAKMGAQISATVLVLLALLFLFQAYKSVEADNKAKSVTAHLTSKSVLDKIDRNYYERFGDVQAFSVNKLVVNRLKGDSTVDNDLQTFVNTMVQYYVLYDLMMICDANGNVIKVNNVDKANEKINSQSLIGKNFASSDWFTTCTSSQGPEGGAWYSDFTVNEDVKQIYNSNGTGMGFAAPIKDENGTVIGVWYNFASWKEVTEGIRQTAEAELQQTTPNSYVVITQKQGSVIDANDRKLVTDNVTLDSIITSSVESKIKFNDSEIKFADMVTGWGHSNGAYIYKGCQWNAITIIPKTELHFSTFASVEMLPMILITLLIIGIAGYLFYKNVQSSVITKIEDLKALLLEFSNGNLPQVSPNLTTNDEIGSIGTAVKTVSENLARLVKVLTSNTNSQTDKDDIVVFNNQGILGNALVNMRTNLKLVAMEEQKRSWATEGMAKFGDILRNNASGLESLSNEIIINLVKYINANQGGVFVVNDSNPKDKFLELTACYAWDKKKYINARIEEGEGLVGQAWQEGNVIYLTEVPANYIRITSGLGNSNPRSIIIIPLIVNDVIYGVIEIASFSVFEEYQIEFLKKLAESIASTLSTTKTNERTKILLQQSQQQTEEMRAQEEEMRQNMEEMEATQEEMERATLEFARASAESTGILKGINSTMATIAFTPDGHVVDANDIFLHTMKCTLNEIKGKHHRNFVPKSILESEDYKTFWTKLANGEAQTGAFERVNSKGETVWLNAIYNPILDEKGKVVKVVKFATDITNEQEILAENKGVLNGINTTMATIEFTPNGNVVNANDNFLHTMKCTLSEIKGKHHSKFVPESILESENYKVFWTKLANNEAQAGIFERVNSKGETVWLNAIYNPILNAKGEVIKVVKFATDVTSEKQKEYEMQRQVEEMRAQEEEIRQNLEEMEATSEEAERKALNYESAIARLNEEINSLTEELNKYKK